METTPQAVARELLEMMANKDKERALSLFAADAVLFDPHYPNPLMSGRAAIGEGLDFAFGLAERLEWTVVRAWEDAESAALQVETNHRFVNGMELTPPQVFVVLVKEGLITSWQSFVPYPPPAAP